MYLNLRIMSRRYCVSPTKKETWYKPSKAGFSGWKGKLTGIYGGMLSYYACALRTFRPVCYLILWVLILYKVEFHFWKPNLYFSTYDFWMIEKKIFRKWRCIKKLNWIQHFEDFEPNVCYFKCLRQSQDWICVSRKNILLCYNIVSLAT